MRDIFKSIKLTSCITLLFLLLGCTASTPTTSIRVDSTPFQFDPTQVKELTLSKFDPMSGDQWIAVFKKTNTGWEIASSPQDKNLLDRNADETFINHLIDTFRTLRIQKDAPHGPLGSFQLSPARFGVQWKTQERSFEFKIGSRVDHQTGSYFSVDNEHVYIADGSTLNMLEMIDSFHFLRKRSWTTLVADDVDEVEIRRKGKVVLYAQREGDVWTDQKHRPLKNDINLLVQKLTASQALKLVDEESEATHLKKWIYSQSTYEASLTTRKGQLTVLKLGLKTGNLYGLNSKRSDTVFVLNPELSNFLFKFGSGSGFSRKF